MRTSYVSLKDVKAERARRVEPKRARALARVARLAELQRLLHALDRLGYPTHAVAEWVGVEPQVVARWAAGSETPTVGSLASVRRLCRKALRHD